MQKNTTRCYVKFKGDGHLTFTTSPTTTSYTLELRKACTHTGGTTIGGRVQLLTYVSNPLGTGTVTVATGGAISIDSGVRVVVGNMTTNGVAVAHGHYNATTLPAVLTGAGRLRIGPPDAFVLVVR